MNRQEVVKLTNIILQVCPQQQIGDDTPLAWYPLLDDLSLADCLEAVASLGKRQPFMAPAEIRAEVRAIRNRRIPDRNELPMPGSHELSDDPKAWAQQMKAINRRLGDGRDLPIRSIEGERLPIQDPKDANQYRAIRDAYDEQRRQAKIATDAERKAKDDAEAEARIAGEAGQRAFGILTLLTDEEFYSAVSRARDELGPDASKDDIQIRAVKLADHTKTKAIQPLREDVLEAIAKTGCNGGCSPLGHEKPCRYANADSPIGRDPEYQA